MSDIVLKHHGVKGMKWGVRRYQNKDGSLTNAGKKRYDRDLRESGGKKKNKQPDPNRWVKEDLNRTKRLTDESSNLVRQLENVNNKKSKKPKTEMDLSSMTDKELREQINRKILERQYNDMFGEQNVSKGRENVGRALEVAGSALAVTSSALGIALAIKELRG